MCSCSGNCSCSNLSLPSIAGPQGPKGEGYLATSTSSVLIGLGSKTFVTQSGLAYLPGDRVRVSNDPTHYMEGVVSSYSTTSLIVTVDRVIGAGTFAVWNIGIAGDVGDTGPTGGTGSTNIVTYTTNTGVSFVAGNDKCVVFFQFPASQLQDSDSYELIFVCQIKNYTPAGPLSFVGPSVTIENTPMVIGGGTSGIKLFQDSDSYSAVNDDYVYVNLTLTRADSGTNPQSVYMQGTMGKASNFLFTSNTIGFSSTKLIVSNPNIISVGADFDLIHYIGLNFQSSGVSMAVQVVHAQVIYRKGEGF